jgi:hypothetical protein
MPLVGFDNDRASREDKADKQNCTDDHVFNPPKNLIEDCAATVVNRMRVPCRNDIIAGGLRQFCCGVGERPLAMCPMISERRDRDTDGIIAAGKEKSRWMPSERL